MSSQGFDLFLFILYQQKSSVLFLLPVDTIWTKMGTMFNCGGCQNKLQWTWWLQRTQIYSPMFWQVASKMKQSMGCAPLRLRDNPVATSSSGAPRSSCMWPHPSSLFLACTLTRAPLLWEFRSLIFVSYKDTCHWFRTHTHIIQKGHILRF